MAYRKNNSAFFGKRKKTYWIDGDVNAEFKKICETIGVDEEIIVNEVLRTFVRDMLKHQEKKTVTFYGDLFPSKGD